MSLSLPPTRSYAGFQPEARLPAASPMVEHWAARGAEGRAELYLAPSRFLARASSLPSHGPFPPVNVGAADDRTFVIVLGHLEVDLEALVQRLSPGAAVSFAWHIAAALADLHEAGDAHGALHPSFAGLDGEGELTLRPALAASLVSEPDPTASAQATDCLQLSAMFEVLELDRVDEPAIGLLLNGLRRERARLRLQPGRAVRQGLAAILARHPAWDRELIDALGPAWSREVGRRPGRHAQRRPPAWQVAVEDRRPLPAPPLSKEARAAAAARAPATVNMDVARAALLMEAPAPRLAPPPPAVAVEEEELDDPITSPQAAEGPALDLEEVAELDPAPTLHIRFAEGEEGPGPTVTPVEESESAEDTDLDDPIGAVAPATAAVVMVAPAVTLAPAVPLPPPVAAAPVALPVPPAPAAPTPATIRTRPPPPPIRPAPIAPRAPPSPPPARVEPPPSPAPARARVEPAPASPPRPPAPTPARPAPELPPEAASEPITDERDRGGPARWEGLSGVTGAESREAELGAGKWTEAARGLDELRDEMDRAPVRELELEPHQASWPLLLGVAIVAALLFAVWWFVPERDPGAVEAPAAEVPAVEEAGDAAAAPALAPVEAAPAAEIRVETDPPGLRVLLDGRGYGIAPARVPVPNDEARHHLCVEKRDGKQVCRDLDRDALLLTDPYRFAAH